MNKNSFNIIIYIVLVVVIVGVFLRLLPYLLIFGGVIWGIVKIYKFFNRKPYSANDTKASSHYKVEENIVDIDEMDISEVIDVDYKDVWFNFLIRCIYLLGNFVLMNTYYGKNIK